MRMGVMRGLLLRTDVIRVVGLRVLRMRTVVMRVMRRGAMRMVRVGVRALRTPELDVRGRGVRMGVLFGVVWGAMGGAWGQGGAGFSIRAALSGPYGLGLTAAPVGERFAWVENAEGVHNVWVGGPGEGARMLTRYHEDDGQDVAGLAWAPDGAALAYVVGAETGQAGAPANPAELQRDTERQLWVVKVGSREAVQVAGGGMAPLFSRDGKRLLFTRKGKIFSVGLGEASGDQRDGQVVGAQQLVWDRGVASGMVLSPDGRWLAYVSRRKEHSFIGLFDLEAKTLRWVAPGTGIDSAPVFSPDGKTLYWLRRPYIEMREFVPQRTAAVSWQVMAAEVAAPEAGREVWAARAGERGSGWPHVAVGEPYLMTAADGSVLFFAETDGWLHVYAAPGKGGEARGARLLTPGAFEVEDARVSPDGKTLWWASNDASADGLDADRRHVWREDLGAGGKAERVTRGAGMETRPVVSGDGKVVAAMAADARVPMHAVMLGSDGGMKEMRAGWLPRGYPGREFVAPEQVVFRAKAGAGTMEIHGQVFVAEGGSAGAGGKQVPRLARNDRQKRKGNGNSEGNGVGESGLGGGGKRPAVVFFHGGPRRQMLLGYPAMEYYSHAYALNEYFASRGYVVLSVNYRCGVGYGMEFRECEHAGAAGASEYNDALAAVEYLRGRGDVDMARVGIWGGSYGGYFTALGLARNSDLFRAGVDFHGVHDWVLEDNAAADWLKGTDAEKDAIAARAREASPIADVAKWRSPVLLIHGDDDANVTYVQTPVLATALRARGVHVEELVFPDEVHEFLLHRDWVRSYEAAADFFVREMK